MCAGHVSLDCCGSLISSIKSEQQQEEEKGVMQFSIFVQFPTLENGAWGLLLCGFSFAIKCHYIIMHPPGLSVILQVSV